MIRKIVNDYSIIGMALFDDEAKKVILYGNDSEN
jgi:hypothetical protein